MVDEKKAKGFRFNNFVTNESLETEGVWISYTSGFKLKLARIGCPAFRDFMLKRSKPHKRQMERGTMDPDIADDLMKEAIAKFIIKDWKGLLDSDDKEIPYSKQKAQELLDASNDFYKEIFELAQDRESFQMDKEETITKKS